VRVSSSPASGDERAELRALVTGASGFIGRHLVPALIEKGYAVRALVRSRARAAVLPEDVEQRLADLAVEDSLRGAADGVDVVFHLGAATAGSWSVHQAATVEGTRRLLRLSVEASVRRFIHVSSIVVFDTTGLRPGGRIEESHPLAAPEPAIGPYARGKVAAELLVRRGERESGLPITIVRPGLVYGPGRVLFPHLGMRRGDLFLAVGGMDVLLPLCSVGSLNDALMRIAETPGAGGEAYTVVDENETTRGDYLRLFSELTGQRHRSVSIPLWPVAAACGGIGLARRLPGFSRLPDTSAGKIRTRALSLRYDTSRLRSSTGWKPAGPLREELARALGIHPGRRMRRTSLRVGIIGAGAVAELHLRALRKIPGADIVGILDAAPGKAESVAGRHGIAHHFDDPGSFYGEAKPEIVHVLTPPNTHEAVAGEALDRGVHVLVEKPMACTPEECRAMKARAGARDVTVGVDHNLLFDPRVVAARRMIEGGAIGEIVHVETLFGFDLRRLPHFSVEPQKRTHWAYGLPGGLLEDLLPHPLYVTLSLLGEKARLTDWRSLASGRLAFDLEDELRLGLTDGAVTAGIVLSLSVQPGSFLVSVYGTRATLRIDIQNMLLQRLKLRPVPKALARGLVVAESSVAGLLKTAWNVASLAAGRATPPGDVRPLLEAHYARLLSGREIPVGFEEGVRVVEIIRRIWPSQGGPPHRPELARTTDS
jgi:predicted dehydrogenase